MRGSIEAIAGSQQDSLLGSCPAEGALLLSAHQPRERGHATFRRNPIENVAMFNHEALKQFEVPGGDILSLAQHYVTPADCDLGKNFSSARVRDREISASIPVLCPALGVMLDHPSRAHSSD